MDRDLTARVLVLAANPCIHDSRVIKSAETLVQQGCQVLIVCNQGTAALHKQVVNGVTYKRIPMRFGFYYRHKLQDETAPAPGQPVYGADKRRTRTLKKTARDIVVAVMGHAINNVILPLNSAITGEIERYRPDVIHAHDLFTLPEALRLAELTGARVIYDAHELETGRNGLKPAGSLLISLIEGEYIKQADAVVTVSEEIAVYLAAKYAIKQPAVVLNAPRMISGKTDGLSIRDAIGIAQTPPLAVYVGSIVPGRGVDKLIDALEYCPGYHVALLGPVAADYQSTLIRRAIRVGADGHLHFIPSVHPDAVIAYIRSADMGVIPIQDTCLSYRYCMPNKLFEMVFAGLPVCVSALPGLDDFIVREKTGLSMDQTDPKDIARAMRELYDRKALYQPGESRLNKLIDRYAWERQALTLTSLYREVLGA